MAFVQVPADSTGKKVETTTDGTTQRQVVNVGQDASVGAAIAPVSATLGLAVDPKTLPPGAATSAKQDTGNTSLAAMVAQSLDYDSGAGTAAQVIVGLALPASGGPVAGGTSTNPVRTDPTGTTTQPISAASLPLPTSAATEATLAGVLTTSDFDSKVGSLTETAPATDTASSGLNGRLQRIAQRLTSLIALLPAALGAGGGLKVDGSGTALPVSGTVTATLAPATSGGCSTNHLVAAASTNATNVKASAGQFYGARIFNNALYPIYLKLHNNAGTPTAGAGVINTIGVQAGTSRDVSIPNGLAFSTGIAFTIVKDITDAGTTAVALSDCVVDIDYK